MPVGVGGRRRVEDMAERSRRENSKRKWHFSYSLSSSPLRGLPPEPTAHPVQRRRPQDPCTGGGAASRDNCVRKQLGDSSWTGSGEITWKVQVDRAGDDQVALGHAAEPRGTCRSAVVAAGSKYTLALTKGVFGNKSSMQNDADQGPSASRREPGSLRLSIPNAPRAMAVLDFRSLGLIPVAAKAAIEAERQEAQRARASTEWIVKAGYGLMFHWTSQTIGKDGTHKPYAQAVDDFDVKPFADMVEATGAGYVFLTIGHAESYCPGPITAWEKYHPGKTTRRDLIAEMADALNAKGIKMMCYLNVASLAEGEARVFLSGLITAVEPVASHLFLVVLADLRHGLRHDPGELLFAGPRVSGETGHVQVAHHLDAFGVERIGHLGNQVAPRRLAGVVFLPGFDRSRTIGLGVADREKHVARSRLLPPCPQRA